MAASLAIVLEEEYYNNNSQSNNNCDNTFQGWVDDRKFN